MIPQLDLKMKNARSANKKKMIQVILSKPDGRRLVEEKFDPQEKLSKVMNEIKVSLAQHQDYTNVSGTQ